MSKLATSILFCALVALYGQTSDVAEYCQALTGELAACKNHLAECEALRKDFTLRSEDRERAIATENAKLKAEIQRLLKKKQALAEEKQKLEAEQQRLQQNHQACLTPLSVAEQALEAKRNQLPKPLQETMLPPLQGDNLSSRLRRFLESIDSIRNFDQQLQKPVPTILTGPDGVQREFKLLYLGLTTAYAVAPEAKIAGFGIRQNGDWELHWRQEYFPAIAQAIEISSGKRPPALLYLPVPANEGDGQ
ncbi:MAG: DUF3450 family protein [Victivallales bacterium]|nr:DUF3450 family protein [Victivallales bacterium]